MIRQIRRYIAYINQENHEIAYCNSGVKKDNMGRGTNLNAFTHRMRPVHDGYFFWNILKKMWNNAYNEDAKVRAYAFVDQ